MLKRLLGLGTKDSAPSRQVPPQGTWQQESPDEARHIRSREWHAYLAARGDAMAAIRAGNAPAAGKAWLESRHLHARWRGYPYNGPTAAAVPFPVSLQVSGVSRNKELSSVVAAHRLDLIPNHRVGKVIAALTFEDQLAWPELTTWAQRFSKMHYRPAMWSDLLLQPEPHPTAEDVKIREMLDSLSPDERMAVAVDGGTAARLDFIAEHLCLSLPDTRTLVAGLATRGLAGFPASAADRLAVALSVDELKALAQERGLIVKGRKLAIATAAAASMSEHEVEAQAPGEYASIRSFGSTPLWEYRIAFADVLAHTLLLGGLREARDLDDGSGVLKGYELSVADDCPACSDYKARVLSVSQTKALPLYLVHPGCRCAFLPVIDTVFRDDR